MINILLAEDHKILREGIKSLLKDDPSISIVAEASNGQEAIDKLSKIKSIDLAILDINMPIMSGLDVAAFISETHKATPVLILSMLDHEKYLLKAFASGAKGYLLKNTGSEELIYAIKRLAKGEVYISSELSFAIMERIRENSDIPVSELNLNLSDREMQILKLLSEGLTNNEISDKLFTSRRTVETHRKNILNKTKSRNTAALIKFAIQNRIIMS